MLQKAGGVAVLGACPEGITAEDTEVRRGNATATVCVSTLVPRVLCGESSFSTFQCLHAGMPTRCDVLLREQRMKGKYNHGHAKGAPPGWLANRPWTPNLQEPLP